MICRDRVVIVTGAGRGLGRAHALAFAAAGARVVANDLGCKLDGSGGGDGAAGEVVEAIRKRGGQAIANGEDVADWAGAGRLVAAAVAEWGRLDVLVNNAGFVRDRMFVSATEDEWDAVLRVHLKGHFACARHAVDHWRARSKAGEAVQARIINTTSGAGLLGSIGQAAYAAAKAGIVGLTLVQAAELGRYGITANAIAPAARTRMTEATFAEMMKAPDSGFDAMAPENVSPLLVWLGSTQSSAVTGRVFDVQGGRVTLVEGHHPGATEDRGARWAPEDIGPAVARLVAGTRPDEKVYGS